MQPTDYSAQGLGRSQAVQPPGQRAPAPWSALPEAPELPPKIVPSTPLLHGKIRIDFDGVYEGHCDGELDDDGKLSGKCEVERIMGSELQDPAFGEPMALSGTVTSDTRGVELKGSIYDEVIFEGLGNRMSASGIWKFASPDGWQQGGRWRANLTLR